MKRLFGMLVYWLAFPALWLILNNTERSRLVMVYDGKLLVVKGFLGAGKWGLPGGGMHKNETPEASLIREVYEELGFQLKPRDIKLILSEPLTAYTIKLSLHYFVAKKPEHVLFKLQKFEISECGWVKLADLNSENANKDTLRAVEAYRQSAD